MLYEPIEREIVPFESQYDYAISVISIALGNETGKSGQYWCDYVVRSWYSMLNPVAIKPVSATTINNLVNDMFGAINRLWDTHGDNLWVYLKPGFNGKPGYRLAIGLIMYPNADLFTVWTNVPEMDKSTAESLRVLGNKHIIQLASLD